MNQRFSKGFNGPIDPVEFSQRNFTGPIKTNYYLILQTFPNCLFHLIKTVEFSDINFEIIYKAYEILIFYSNLYKKTKESFNDRWIFLNLTPNNFAELIRGNKNLAVSVREEKSREHTSYSTERQSHGNIC